MFPIPPASPDHTIGRAFCCNLLFVSLSGVEGKQKGFPLQSLTQNSETTFFKIPDFKYFKSQTKILLLKKKLKIMYEDKKVIARDLALAMSKAYEIRRAKHKPDMGSNKEDTKYVYINREVLQQYLDDNKNAKGIKAYFGVIDNHKIASDPKYTCKPELRFQTTIILKATGDASFIEKDPLIAIPTYNSDGEPLDDFELCPPPSGGCNDIY